MQSPKPSVSVLLPTYNGIQFIEDAIESVLAQTYKNLEIIVVDDGSEDKTSDFVAARFGAQIKLITQKNGGKAAAINNGVSACRGEFIALLDDDDRWLPDKIASQIALAESDSANIGVVGGGAYFIDAQGVRVSNPEIARPEINYEQACIKASIPGIGTNILFSRKVFDLVGGFDPGLRRCQDIEFVRRAARISRIVNVPEPTVEVRVYPRSLPDLAIIKQCRERIIARIEEPRIRRKARAWFYFSYGRNLSVRGHRFRGALYRIRSFLVYPLPIGTGAERLAILTRVPGRIIRVLSR